MHIKQHNLDHINPHIHTKYTHAFCCMDVVQSLVKMVQHPPPSRPAPGVPRVLHYGLLYSVVGKEGKWSWDKHWYHEFDMYKCPPWKLDVPRPQEGLFPPPPGVDDLLPNVSTMTVTVTVTVTWFGTHNRESAAQRGVDCNNTPTPANNTLQ